MIADLPTQPRRAVWVPLFLSLVIIIAFSGLATAEFSYLDDNYNLFENPRMNPPTWDSLGFYWTHQEHGLYVPLTYTVWSILAVIGRVSPDPMGIALNPWVFHCANIGIHVLSVLGVYALLMRLLGDRTAACIGALLFGLHPVQVESVAWVAGLKDVLAGMLGVVALWQYARWAKVKAGSASESIHNNYYVVEPKVYYVLATVAFVLALLAKPSAIVIPVIAGVIDLGVLRRRFLDVAVALMPWMMLAIVFAIVGSIAQPATGVTPAPYWARPLVMLDALAFYLYKLVFPFWLGVDYGRTPGFVMSHGWFYLTWLVPAGLAMVLWINRERWPEWVVSGLIFTAALGPVLGLVTFLYQYRSTTADHYLYLAMLGPALAAGAVVKRYRNAAVLAGSVVILIVLGMMTMLQTRVWGDDLQLFTHALKVNPNSVMSLHNLGHAYAIRGRPERGVPYLKEAVERDPTYVESYEYLARLLKESGRPREAIPYRLKALELAEHRPAALQEYLTDQFISVGQDLLDAGRLEEARGLFQKALDRTPDAPLAIEGLRIIGEKSKAPATSQGRATD